MVYHNNAFYIFGGLGGEEIEIVQLDSAYNWTKVDKLAASRYDHSAIFINGHFLLVGGKGQYQTEKCTLIDGEIECIQQEPELNSYKNFSKPLPISGFTFCGANLP